MNITLGVVWISNCDYPLFRQWLKRYHSFFKEVIICWDINFRFPIFQSFIQSSLSDLPNIKFLDTPDRKIGGDDWRHVNTTEIIKNMTGDWFVSIEQDWFCKNWDVVLAKTRHEMDRSDLVGWENPTNFPYIHPAYFFIKKDLLLKTGADFSPHPEINGSDHYAMITKKAKELNARIMTLQDLGLDCNFSASADCFHLGGVNSNYLNGLQEGFKFHRPEVFVVYNFECRRASVPQNSKFLGLSQDIEDKLLSTMVTPISLGNNQWSPFFK